MKPKQRGQNENHTPVPIADVEPDISDASLGTKKTKGLDTRCRIHLHSKRKRLADPDGISGKAVLDGLVHAGILPDDSAKQIESVTFSQEKTKGPEVTEITITPFTGFTGE
jgi:Holliday junction resolvase RusA-like endonuclease